MADTPLTQAATILDEVIRKMGLEASVVIENEASPQLSVAMEDPARLIGHKGEGLYALQHLVRMMLLAKGERLPVIVDIDGYRSRQHDALKETAARKAKEVRDTGQQASFPPMTSYERRLIHTVVADIDGVASESRGEGRTRRVVIKPA